MRLSHRIFWAVTWIVSLLQGVAVAARPSETLFPDTTKGFLSIANVRELKESWKQTQLGQLLDDPSMKPFLDEVQQQLERTWSIAEDRVGISLDDLKEVPSGEVGVGVIVTKESSPSFAVTADVTDNVEKTNELLDRLAKNLTEDGAKRREIQLHDTPVVVYDLPEDEEGNSARQVFYALKDNLLCASDSQATLEGILSRFSGEHEEALVNLKAYQRVMSRCAADAGQDAPQVRWFIEPIAFAEAIRATIPKKEIDASAEGTDMLSVAKHQGFECIRGIGGYVNVALRQYEVLHRTAIYAPPPYEKAMRMLVFPNTGNLAPESWMPTDVALFVTFNWDMKNAFEMSSTLVDELFGEGEEGVLEDIIESVRDDPDGPGIDIRKDLIGHLGTRAMFVTDYKLPITPESERILFAAETTNEEALAVAVRKSMEGDPTVIRREFEGHVIWEMVPGDELAAPEVEIGNALPLGNDEETAKEDKGPGENILGEDGALLGRSAITVARGYLFIASHVDFLQKVLLEGTDRETLSESVDYRLVSEELARLTPSENCARIFVRTDETYRPTYELIRTGQMPQAQTMLGKMLNMVLNGGDKEKVREQQIDGSKLPDYEVVRRYLGPAGVAITSEPEGWFVVGFTLNKQAP